MPSGPTALGGGAPTASHISDTAVLKYRPTETLPLLSAMLLDFAGLCRPYLPGLAAIPAQNPGFSRNQGEIRRETDCLLEGNGFELPVRERCKRGLRRKSPASAACRRRSSAAAVGSH